MCTGICAIILALRLHFPAIAQLVLNRHITATTGGSGKAGPVSIQYTIEEPVIAMITDGRVVPTIK
ncbi:hypothetical protein DCM91_03400 [Chitinophaga costaii]|nr:hypothetical protein DCM91_03400 [Chitinophaga costaii]